MASQSIQGAMRELADLIREREASLDPITRIKLKSLLLNLEAIQRRTTARDATMQELVTNLYKAG